MDTVGAQYWLTRLCFQRSLGFIYLIGFIIAVNQFRALAGEHGLSPAPFFLRQVRFWDAPSLFWLSCTDRSIAIVSWAGVLLAVTAVTGLSESFGPWVSAGVWFLLWLLYLSLVNVGQIFYGYGWESLLLETGFLAIFLGSREVTPPVVVIWLLRWVLFRLMFGAGLIKLRGDACWRDLTCMQYHYETQPLPNPLSYYFHRLPALVQKASVLWTHFIEIVVPWGIFVPGPVCAVAGCLTAFFQFTLILSGNLSWLNYITIVLCIPCLDDALLSHVVSVTAPALAPLTLFHKGALIALAAMVALLSIRPTVNLFSPGQMMNASFEPLHLVNTYGAFGSIGRERYEVILEGTLDPPEIAKWTEYQFKGKPGDVNRRPCIVSPYHYRLDWQMWFAAMGPYWQHPWVLPFIAKLLKNDAAILSLMAGNPFPDRPPRYIRARLYRYRYTGPGEKSRAWWKRELAEEYLPPLSLQNAQFLGMLKEMGVED